MSQLTILPQLEARIQTYGLAILSPILNGDAIDQASEGRFDSILLVGSVGSSFWPHFASSAEYLDGQADPLDRWSRKMGDALALDFDCEALFPFDGPPYWPFLTWASLTGRSQTSMLGMHVHPEYGLWQAFRFALAFRASPPAMVASDGTVEVCARCTSRDCLTSCPVDAFTESGYDVNRCFGYLRANPDAPCHTRGCLARRACPVGAEHRYTQEHAGFHMQEFMKARSLADL